MVPVAVVQVGCVTDAVGAAGTDGCALITTLPEAVDVHPIELVTVNV